MAKQKATIWAFDCETPKFKYGRVPVPFLWCAVSEFGDRVIFWGDKCTTEFMDWILEQENILLIGHNSGKFDTLFLKPIVHGAMLLVDGRIIKCSPKSGIEIRDSFAILPMALKKLGAKLEIDLDKHEDDCREKHRQEITHYCINDCIVLLEAVLNFYNRAGSRKLTIASQASSELRAIYPDLPKLGERHHREFSPFFFGGRVQCFKKGIIRGRFRLLDVNSMYPDVMANCHHPFGDSYRALPFSVKNMPDNNCGFFSGVVDSNGAFAIRQQDKTTPYSVGKNLPLRTTIHELRAAIDCGLVSNIRGHLFLSNNSTTFEKFIIPHFAARRAAQLAGDLGGDVYHKLIPNSSYGRFAMSPDGRKQIYYAEHGEDIAPLLAAGWIKSDIDLDAERWILEQPVSRPWLFYEDVATGASITGAARAKLMRAIHSARNPLYCDTDSLLCEEFEGKTGNELGQWKIEAENIDTVAIAGKKMYALYSNGECVKQASKGVRASAGEIYQVAEGAKLTIENEAPVMRLKSTKFMTRKIRST
jgi:hypothetical protein